MATFRFTSPTGESYRIDAPDDATDEQAWEFFRSQFQQPESQMSGAEMVAQETGPFEAALVGAGKAALDLGRGVQDLYYRATGDDAARAELEARQAEEEALYEPLREERPFATGLGEAVPYIAGGSLVGTAARGAGALANIGSQAAGGAAIGGTSYAPTLEERASNALVEGALSGGGELLGRALLRTFNPGVAVAGGGQEQVTRMAEEAGYKILPSSRLESDTLRQTIEGGLESTPGGAVELSKITGHNQDLFNRRAAESIGETAEKLTGDVIENAYTRIGGVFDDVLGEDTVIRMDDQLLEDVMMIDDDQIKPMLIDPASPMSKVVDRAYEMIEKGEVTGRELHAQQSRLGKAARSAMTGQNSNPEFGMALFDLQRALLKAAERSMEPGAAAALRDARMQYKNLANLTAPGVTETVKGDVSAAKLANRLAKKDRHRFHKLEDAPDLYRDAAFLGRVQAPLRSSGTAERSYLQSLLKNLPLIGTAGGAASGGVGADGSLGGGVMGAGAGYAGALLAPGVLARAYLRPSVSRWLTRQAGPIQQGVMAPAMQGLTHGLLGP